VKLIKNVHCYDFVNLKKSQYVVFDDKIVETGDQKDFAQAIKKYGIVDSDIVDGNEGMLLPGLALCHTHIYSTFARGMSVPFNPNDFREILEQLWWKLDAQIDKEVMYSSAMVSGLGYLQHGVTSIIDHHASGKDILGTLEQIRSAVVDQFGLRGMFCFETSDRYNVDECIQENVEFSQQQKPGSWSSHFGLHASMTLSDETLKKVKEHLGDLPIHIHVAESELDQKDANDQYGTSVVKRLDKFGLLNKDSLLVHGIYLSDEEMEIIAKRGCYVVLNPSSNMNNGVGLSDYKRLKKHGVPVLLGNDGMSTAIANEWQALLFAMHDRYGDPRAFGLVDLLEIIQNGYDYVSRRLGVKLGRIQEGYKADLILLDTDYPTPLDDSNALGHLFFGFAQSFRPSYVWANGELKLNNYQVQADSTKIYEDAREIAGRLWDRL
jgi:putative selenium metabolism protein SsnA